ncbi:HWE histidine kinase domain-containing protein [Roseicella aerolata]|uniref:histidine kinase n=1 Tax=Roseicella aerolata TaxID=2883479 RepID=A0A9X1IJ73_9PROT|nr:cache domain-containing protein [Roseicella aerolata]MCB4825104.1 hypothetical protein [Roseicella aerolata]
MDSSGTTACGRTPPVAPPRAGASTQPAGRPPARFRTHLLGLSLGTGLPLVALAIGLAWWIAADQRRTALRDLSRAADALQTELDRELRITATALEALATSPTLDAAVEGEPAPPAAAAFWSQARALIAHRPDVLHNIALFDAQGRHRMNTLVPPDQPLPGLGLVRFPLQGPQPIDPLEFFGAILRRRETYVSPLFVGPLAGRPVISIAMAVRRGEAVTALLAANILPASLGAVLRGQRLQPRWVATLVDNRGLVIARTRWEDQAFGRPAPDWLVEFQRGGGAGTTIRTTAPDGTPTYAALRHMPQGDWALALSVPRAAVDGPLQLAVASASAGGALAVALAALLAHRIGARLGREVEALGADAARVVREQPLAPRPPPRVREVAEVRQALAAAHTALRARAAAKREAEEHLVLLLREVDHRAKNALAVALSLIRLSPRDVPPAEFAAAAEGRITTMARAHALLARSAWTGAELQALVESELPVQAGQVGLAGPPARLSAEAVQPVAMLLHELATNAAKHGALSLPGGEVQITWEFLPGDQALRLVWAERGGPPLAGPPARRSFGLRLMTQLAERQLAGRLCFDWAAAGLRATLTLPAGRAAPEGTALARPAQKARPPAVAPRPAWTGPDAPPPRVLVVEDEALLALELETGLRELGCEVIGPARNLAEASRLAASEPRLTAAVLDVNLGGGELVFPVADLLAARGVPYLLATGYGSAGPLEGRDAKAAAVLRKPYQRAALAAALAQALPGDASGTSP